jgi:hypothetical protein
VLAGATVDTLEVGKGVDKNYVYGGPLKRDADAPTLIARRPPYNLLSRGFTWISTVIFTNGGRE